VSGEGPIEQARLRYERAVFFGEVDGLAVGERELDAVEADLSLARGRILHARYLDTRQEDPRERPLFERAVELYRALGDVRGEAEALFWLACFDQVVRGEHDSVVSVLERSYELATAAGDKLTMSYAVRHLGFAEMAAGRLDEARDRLECSVQLRRDIGFQPGVAAGLVALAELVAQAGQHDEARRLVEEAAAVAEESGARGVLRWVDQARAELPPDSSGEDVLR
jgi:tetratricopeptide (TPR) repeat protein